MRASNNKKSENSKRPEEKAYDLPWHSQATRFWWVRHAPVTHLKHLMYGTMDVDADLSDDRHIRSLGWRLPENAVWYTSHLKRTQQTADAVAAAGATCAERYVSPLIGEMEFGEDTGKTHQELLDERDDPYVGFWPKSPLAPSTDAESMADVCSRIEQFVTECADKHPQQDVVCFSHMGAILAALTNALSLDLHNSVCFSILNLSVTQIHYHNTLHPQAPQYRVMSVSEIAADQP